MTDQPTVPEASKQKKRRWLDEDLWLKGAIFCAVSIFLLFSTVIIYIIFSSNSTRDLNRSIDSLYKIGILGIAIVTFMTVIWRGLVSTKQVEAQVQATLYQAEQITLVTKQNERGQRNELAGLLQKGAELLSSEEQTDRSAGLATLHAVAVSKQEFSQQALNILAEHLEVTGSEQFSTRECKNTIQVIEDVYKKCGISADYAITIEAKDEKTRFALISGIRRIRYKNGQFSVFGTSASHEIGNNFRFENVRFEGGAHDVTFLKYKKCRIVSAKINIYTMSSTETNVFENCDFSGCKLTIRPGSNIYGRGNFYYVDSPPVDRDGDEIDKAWLVSNLREKPIVTKAQH